MRIDYVSADYVFHLPAHRGRLAVESVQARGVVMEMYERPALYIWTKDETPMLFLGILVGEGPMFDRSEVYGESVSLQSLPKTRTIRSILTRWKKAGRPDYLNLD